MDIQTLAMSVAMARKSGGPSAVYASNVYVDGETRLSALLEDMLSRLSALEGGGDAPAPAPSAAAFGAAVFGTAVFG